MVGTQQTLIEPESCVKHSNAGSETVDAGKCALPYFLQLEVGNPEIWTVACARQVGRRHQEIFSQSLEGRRLQVSGQARALEPDDTVVGQ